MDERDDKMRQIAADLGIDWDELKACEDAWLAREQGWVAEDGDADRFRQGFSLFRAGKSRPTVRG